MNHVRASALWRYYQIKYVVSTVDDPSRAFQRHTKLQLTTPCNQAEKSRNPLFKQVSCRNTSGSTKQQQLPRPCVNQKACEQANCQKCTQCAWGSQKWGTPASFQLRSRTAILRVLLDTQNLEQSKILQNSCIQ